jgi:2-methylisocitrate lyase-like PEP mutase family enzyme
VASALGTGRTLRTDVWGQLYAPMRTVAQLGELGVGRVSLGSLLFRVALGAAVSAATDIRAGRPVRGKAPTYSEVQQLCPGIDPDLAK